MPAFKNAVAQGCNLLELDIMRTRDDEIICCHDEYLGRLTGNHHDVVIDFDYADLPPML